MVCLRVGAWIRAWSRQTFASTPALSSVQRTAAKTHARLVFPNIETLKKLGPLNVNDFADLPFARKFIDYHFAGTSCVIPARLKEGMLAALYPKSVTVTTEKEGACFQSYPDFISYQGVHSSDGHTMSVKNHTSIHIHITHTHTHP